MLQTAIANVVKIGDEIWSAELTPSEVSALGHPAAQEDGPSVIFLGPVTKSANGLTLIFPANGAKVLNRGNSNEILIVSRTPVAPNSGDQQAKVSGDAAFMAEAAKCSSDVEEFAQRMLKAVRKIDPKGDLVSYPGRRFINKPDNFITLVPQPRVRQLKIIVRGSPVEFVNGPEDLKKDQNGYSTFKIRNVSGLKVALHFIEQVRRKH